VAGHLRLLLALTGVLALVPTNVAAQMGCEFGEGTTEAQMQVRAPGDTINRVLTPHLVCEDGVEIWADSAIARQGVANFLGAVRYLDRSRELRAASARYFARTGRLEAQGRVRVTSHEDGSTVENGDLVYTRESAVNEIEEMTVTTGSDGLRPRATLYPKRPEAPTDSVAPADSLPPVVEPQEPAEPPEPQRYIVVGDRIYFRGDSYFNAKGMVEIERDSLFAYADSAEYNGDDGALVLEGSASVDGATYDLIGKTITLVSAADGSDEVRAVRDAMLIGEDIDVTAAQILLNLVDGEVEHMVAVPVAADTAWAPQPRAVSEDFELVGDSLDLAAPAGVLQRVFAAGHARSVSTSRDDLNVEDLPDIARTDWMDGDTIEVFLVPVEPGSTSSADDTGNDYEVERIIARVGARSLYRMTPSDSTAVPGVDPPAISYMVADEITIYMVDGQADHVESVGQVNGWHLEPLKREPADSTATPSDATEPIPPPVPVASALGDVGGDGAPPAAYLSPVRASQLWRFE
jgi:lipopolysaccharide export system protein LptA